jgi:hypothetical protein
MLPQSILEIINCAHLSKYVSSDFDERGGIMLVGPPGVLKTTIITNALDPFPDKLVMSDLTLPSFKVMRDDFTNKRYTTIGLTAYEKLYERQASTASNLEGLIKGLVCEGWQTFSTEDQRMPGSKTRALVVGGMTQDLLSRKYTEWQTSGFSRRFLWIVMRLHDPYVIARAIHEWRLIEFSNVVTKVPGNGRIHYNLTEDESRYIGHLVREQPGYSGIAYSLMKKIACVLKWKYDAETMMAILSDVEKALSNKGDELILEPKSESSPVPPASNVTKFSSQKTKPKPAGRLRTKGKRA